MGKPRPSNPHPPRGRVAGAVDDELQAPGTAPRQGHDATVRVDGVLNSLNLFPRHSALTLKTKQMRSPWRCVPFTPPPVPYEAEDKELRMSEGSRGGHLCRLWGK